MKKKLVSALLLTTMSLSLLAGCGESADTTPATTGGDTTTTTTTPDEPDAAQVSVAEGEEEGKVLNIQVWNEEFKSRVTNYYPGYEEVDATHGKIGDVDVVWTITPSDDNAYQNNLDKVLPANADAAADDKVDIFLVEADYALKYVDSEAGVAIPMKDLGITDADIADQYKYTQDIVTDSNGVLRGLSWQACSAGVIYNREIAKAVLGSDDPADVQAAIKDWDAFKATAADVAAKGYKMCSVNDTFRTYSNNVKTPWVVDGKVTVDDSIKAWIDDSKELVDAKALTTDDLWLDDWAQGKKGGVFCYFGPAWFFNFCLDADAEGTVAHDGGWGFCEGPQGYYWGGTWICAANGTDNPTLVKDILLTMTTDEAVLKAIAVGESECVNNSKVLAELAGSDEGNIALLGGQNPYAELAAGAENIKMVTSAYDQGCNESIQEVMKDYFKGTVDYDTAMANFQTSVSEKYPELTF